MYKDYPYQSVLSPYINGLIEEKRKLGFLYNAEAYELYRFDTYWRMSGKQSVQIAFDDLSEWLSQRPGEGWRCQSRRIQAAKNLALYMNSIGISCYVPLVSIKKKPTVVHILNESEIQELFKVIDSHTSATPWKNFQRMAKEYPMIYRFLYCCGMRNNEVCSLRTEDVDLTNGILTIRDGKNHKDRLVYLSEDLRCIASAYYTFLKNRLGYSPDWFFPGKYPEQHISKNHVDKKFSEFWKMTEASKSCDKAPTPHCLRHTFVVTRINRWVLEGKGLDVMLDYLSQYLGHKGPEESFYYYHLVDEAFKITRAKDTMVSKVIPEVKRI